MKTVVVKLNGSVLTGMETLISSRDNPKSRNLLFLNYLFEKKESHKFRNLLIMELSN
jgi:hypothetical protein